MASGPESNRETGCWPQLAKVFWFFFSKENFFSSLKHRDLSDTDMPEASGNRRAGSGSKTAERASRAKGCR
jgi:hypothetical protein